MVPDVNAHIHMPYSFSAFGSISEALDKAAAEGVRVVGINDFYSTEGFVEWRDGCAQRSLYPLYGIEFIALDTRLQASGLRVNDPGNPGRIYLSGKGLACPPILSGTPAKELKRVRGEANAHAERMCGKLNAYLRSEGCPVQLDFEQIKSNLTCGLVRERHIAKALRLALYPDADAPAALENELRSRLLKAGGPAFVPEDPSAFLPVESVQGIIGAAGGITTYPFLVPWRQCQRRIYPLRGRPPEGRRPAARTRDRQCGIHHHTQFYCRFRAVCRLSRRRRFHSELRV